MALVGSDTYIQTKHKADMVYFFFFPRFCQFYKSLYESVFELQEAFVSSSTQSIKIFFGLTEN